MKILYFELGASSLVDNKVLSTKNKAHDSEVNKWEEFLMP
jgi:hypothetical protein